MHRVARRPGTNSYFFTGGLCYDTNNTEVTHLMFSYDFDSGMWTTHAQMATGRHAHGMVFTKGGDQILVTGGKSRYRTPSCCIINSSLSTWKYRFSYDH